MMPRRVEQNSIKIRHRNNNYIFFFCVFLRYRNGICVQWTYRHLRAATNTENSCKICFFFHPWVSSFFDLLMIFRGWVSIIDALDDKNHEIHLTFLFFFFDLIVRKLEDSSIVFQLSTDLQFRIIWFIVYRRRPLIIYSSINFLVAPFFFECRRNGEREKKWKKKYIYQKFNNGVRWK